MADMKKEQERDELHRAIWAIADELRGAVDGWDFKNYVLGTMFYRYISENLCNYINSGEIEAGNTDFDYAKLPDEEAEEAREDLVQEKGFFILPSELFCNVCARAAQDENLNETLETVFRNIEESAKGSQSEGDFAGLFDDFDVNSNKLGATVAKRNEKLVKLLNGVAAMNLGDVKDHNIDAFGDAYEYLMTMYASNAGKSGGEFFTPAEVSELLTRLGTVGKTEVNKVYDPACGSGSLLLKAVKVLGHDGVRNGFYGQEINITTYNLCRINMFLHDIDFDKFNIACEDTLTCPQHWDEEPFDLIVSNPPYSIKWAGNDNPLLINDPRFAPAGVLAPKSKADMAFIMHCLSWLATNGTAAIVCFPGVLYRGGAEKKIRQYLIDNNFVDCVIQLPSNLFFGTTIATCIVVLKKNKIDNRTLFIDASAEFVKTTNNNKIAEENIKRVVDEFVSRANVDYFARTVPYEEIAENDYNLSVGTYIEPENTGKQIDIEKLNVEISRIVSKEESLRQDIENFVMREHYAALRNLEASRPDITTYQLRDLVDFQSGKGHEKDIVEQGKYIVVNSKFIASFGAVKKFSDKQNCPVEAGDILMVMSDLPNGRALAKCFLVDENDRYTLNQRIGAFRVTRSDIIKTKFLYYLLNRNRQLLRYDNGVDQTNLRKNEILNILIPVPSVDVQDYIVSVLDRFETLCNDLSCGLPAELEARKKQYEYYKQKMLNFEI